MKACLTALFLFCLAVGFSGCKSEKVLSEEFDPAKLKGPIGIAIVPGTDLAMVTSSNYNLEYRNGALSVIDLTNEKILPELTKEIPNFSGELYIDQTRGRILVANRYNSTAIVYDYSVPGSGTDPIGITEPDLPNAGLGTKNQIELEENPFGVMLAEPSGILPKFYVTNIESGDVSVLKASDLSIIDAHTEVTQDTNNEDSRGIPLISVASIGVSSRNDGIGANRMALTPDSRLVYVTSSQSNSIFIIDTLDDKVEGVLDLSKYASNTVGMRGIKIASDGLLYVIHRGLGGLIVLDANGIRDDGMNNEMIQENFIAFVPVPDGPEDLILGPSEAKIYVTCVEGAGVKVIDRLFLTPVKTIETERGPTGIALDPITAKAYVTNFYSDSITVIDTATDTAEGLIK